MPRIHACADAGRKMVSQMDVELLNILVCPVSKEPLEPVGLVIEDGVAVRGGLRCASCDHVFKITDQALDLLPWPECGSLPG